MWIPLRSSRDTEYRSINSFDRCINYAAVSVSQGGRASPALAQAHGGRSRGPIDIGGIPVGEFPYESPTMRITKRPNGKAVDFSYTDDN